MHAPQCQEVAATGDTNYTANFTLAKETATITFSGTISSLDEATDTAVLSIRQHNFDCGGTENVTIEVTSDDFTNGSFSITIPAPVDTKYDLVASADGKITVVEEDIDVDTTIDIVFQPL